MFLIITASNLIISVKSQHCLLTAQKLNGVHSDVSFSWALFLFLFFCPFNFFQLVPKCSDVLQINWNSVGGYIPICCYDFEIYICNIFPFIFHGEIWTLNLMLSKLIEIHHTLNFLSLTQIYYKTYLLTSFCRALKQSSVFWKKTPSKIYSYQKAISIKSIKAQSWSKLYDNMIRFSWTHEGIYFLHSKPT